ncbi:MAG: DNA polymerase IV [Candidatus Gracilibacteria bacterium]|jgi:DNA polymerase V|nr:DNA polymerase IV [Candidatus Gracilibacteria bacterium]
MKLIAHVDADSFYVSCERVRSPGLIGKPVCVLGNQGAIVIARSYEAKKTGVKVGTPVWEAKKMYPDMVFVKRDFRWYSVLSEAMQDVLHKFSDTIEYYSVDESFVDLGDYNGDVHNLAAEIQNAVKQNTGLPVSVGISLTKTLAKIASDKNKPLGICVVLRDDLSLFLADTLVSEVSGIGVNLEKRLTPIGIVTARDFVQKDRIFIKKILNKPGEVLWYELKGNFVLPVRNERPRRKGVSRGGSLFGAKSEKNIVFAFMVRNIEKLCDALLKQKLEIKNLVLFLVTDSGFFLKGEGILLDFTNSFSVILEEFKAIFYRVFSGFYKYKGLHVMGFNIRDFSPKQLSIFDFSGEKGRKMDKIRESVLKKHGLFAVRSANTAYINDVFRDDASNFEISDMDKKFCF